MTSTNLNKMLYGRIMATGLVPLLLWGCALSPVTNSTRDDINAHVHAGMTMSDARNEMESIDYLCRTRSGSYFDENGEEHVVSSPFVICDARPGTFSFVCNDRTQVTLVPDGDRVRNVQITKAPSCIKQ